MSNAGGGAAAVIRATNVARSIGVAIEGWFLEIVGLDEDAANGPGRRICYQRMRFGHCDQHALTHKTDHASSLVHRSFDVGALRLRGEPPERLLALRSRTGWAGRGARPSWSGRHERNSYSLRGNRMSPNLLCCMQRE